MFVVRARRGFSIESWRVPPSPGGGRHRRSATGTRTFCSGGPRPSCSSTTQRCCQVLVPFAPSVTVIDRVVDRLEAVLGVLKVDPGFVAHELAEMREHRISKTANRSVVGVMNEFRSSPMPPRRKSARRSARDFSAAIRYALPAARRSRRLSPIVSLPRSSRSGRHRRRDWCRSVASIRFGAIGGRPWGRCTSSGQPSSEPSHRCGVASWCRATTRSTGSTTCCGTRSDGGTTTCTSSSSSNPIRHRRRRVGSAQQRVDRPVVTRRQAGTTFTYVYDFGDNWRHKVVIEDIVEQDADVDYPLCIDGRRACPPEDCGGVEG